MRSDALGVSASEGSATESGSRPGGSGTGGNAGRSSGYLTRSTCAAGSSGSSAGVLSTSAGGDALIYVYIRYDLISLTP